MPDIFLSYSREDQVTARRFAEGFEREGFSVWWDQSLDAGESFDKVTEQTLKEANAVVVLWSKHAVDSRWVRAEATQADRFGTLVPVAIEPCDRPIMFELTHTADLSGWSGDVTAAPWRAFIEGLRRTVGKTATSPVATASAACAAPGTSAAVTLLTSSRTAITWTVMSAAVLLAAGLFWYFQGRGANRPAVAVAAGATVAASIAVLPFRDMSPNKDQEYFADGVTEEILNTLAGIKNLKVTARTSAFAFKGKDVDLRKVGEALGVQHILEGSIRKDGESLRITAQLISAKTDAHVWSKTYDRQLKDVFQVQEEISRSVAEALQVTLGVGFGKQSGMTRDIDAYDAYLAADAPLVQLTPESTRRGIELLQRAVARDPAFGLASVRLYLAYMEMTNLEAANPQGWMQKADAALEKLQRVAPPDAPSLHLLHCLRSMSQGRWAEAMAHYRAAFEAAARLGEVLDSGYELLILQSVGQTRQAIALLEQNRARDPLNPDVTFDLALAYGAAGDVSAAKAESERAYKLGGPAQYAFSSVALTNAIGTRDRTLVRRALDDFIAISPDSSDSDLNARMRSMLERPAEALTLLRSQAHGPSASSLALVILAQWLAYFGDPEAALAALRTAFQSGGGGPILASRNLWAQVFSEARKLPAFKQLSRDFGLVDYWREDDWGDFCKPVGETDFECN
jgi:TolB-like protein